MFQYVRSLIALRHAHPVLRGATKPAHCGWPDVSLHNLGVAWNNEMNDDTRQIGVLFSGRNADDTADDLVLIAINSHWEAHEQQVPKPPEGMHWVLTLHTFAQNAFTPDIPFDGQCFTLGARSVAVVTAEMDRAL